jgi:hypothetical protein
MVNIFTAQEEAASFISKCYRVLFNKIDAFKTLRCAATGVPLAAKRTRIFADDSACR